MPGDGKEIVRRGYDAVSERYRADDGSPQEYEVWLCALTALLPAKADVLVHLPEHEQETLIHSFQTWPRPGGVLVATVGASAWTGEEADWLGGAARMWWSHPGADTYREWLESAGLTIEHGDFVPEGDGGHQLFIARAH